MIRGGEVFPVAGMVAPEAKIERKVRRKSVAVMDTDTPQGTKRIIDGQWRVFYDGYWIKAYDVPANTLLAKKQLIEALTRRLFNHVEHGLNIPGHRLSHSRAVSSPATSVCT